MTALPPDLCGPWIGFTEVNRIPKYAALTEEQIAPYLMPASEICFKLSGRQFPGVCTVNDLRPCRQWWRGPDWRVPSVWGATVPLWWGWCRCGGTPWAGECQCTDGIDQLDLEPYAPVQSIDEVRIDGVVLASSKYVVYDWRWLARIDGGVWPTVNRLDRDNTGADTWSIDLTFGLRPPEDAQLAAATLAGEFALSANPGAGVCTLPERIQSVSRQGVSYLLLDPQLYLDAGRTGIYMIDLWLRATNPSGITRKATISYPGKVGRPGRVRQP